jgi:hypothetical protein
LRTPADVWIDGYRPGIMRMSGFKLGIMSPINRIERNMNACVSVF